MVKKVIVHKIINCEITFQLTHVPLPSSMYFCTHVIFLNSSRNEFHGTRDPVLKRASTCFAHPLCTSSNFANRSSLSCGTFASVVENVTTTSGVGVRFVEFVAPLAPLCGSDVHEEVLLPLLHRFITMI